jgi:peptidyl-prolyl cis-trans isomerase A (cyclophilin A)
MVLKLALMNIFIVGTCFAQAPTPAQVKSINASTPTPTPTGTPLEKVTDKNKSHKKGFKRMYALFDTTLGKIKVELFFDKAPETVNNFVDLAEGNKEYKDPNSGTKKKGHFYDGLTFHRTIPKFMIQGGDPLGTGTGGPGYQFKDEIYPDLQFDKEGVLAMANAGKDTNGSQFFITVARTEWLNGKHTIFGQVVEGMDVVKKISETPRDQMTDAPLKPVKINKVTIIRK